MNKMDIFPAVRLNDKKKYSEWLDTKSSINILNEENETLLQSAIAYGQNEIALDLIKRGIILNAQNKDGQTSLHYAVEYSNVELVKAIISNGGNTNIRDEHGNNPLWTAVINARGNYEIVKFLIDKHSDPFTKNKYGKSPLDFALQINDQELIKILERNM